MVSHFEAYVCVITEQEKGTKDLLRRREKLDLQPSKTANKCRQCKKEVEYVMQCPLDIIYL